MKTFIVILLGGLLAMPSYGLIAIESIPNDMYRVRLEDGHARWGSEASSSLPSVSTIAAQMEAISGGTVTAVFDDVIQGFAIRGNEKAIRSLIVDSRVRSVTKDEAFQLQLEICGTGCPSPVIETVPIPGNVGSPRPISCDDPEPNSNDCESNWGLDRIDQRTLPRDDSYDDSEVNGNGIDVFVLDTGVWPDHPEFWTAHNNQTSRVSAGYDAWTVAIGGDHPTDGNDQHCGRHGTSVASVIGGRIYGVAPKVNIHPVRFANSSGFSFENSWLVAMEWVIEQLDSNTPAVINISSNPAADDFELDQDLRDAFETLRQLNVPIVQSAGNKSDRDGDACYWTLTDPARNGIEEVIVAGGIDEFDQLWTRDAADPQNGICSNPYFDCGSNTGSCVDVWAPAAHIVMAFGFPSGNANEQAVCTSSGTSFAAPHVTGVVALYLQQNPNATVAEVEAAVRGSAWKDLLPASINDPDPMGPESNNLLISNRINRRINLVTEVETSLGSTVGAIRLTATVTNLFWQTAEDSTVTVRFGPAADSTIYLGPPDFTITPLGAAQNCQLSEVAGPAFPVRTFHCQLGDLERGDPVSLEWEVMPPGAQSNDLDISADSESSFRDVLPSNNHDEAVIDSLFVW